jgi:Caspase domain
MLARVIAAIVVLLLWPAAALAQAEKRIALLIGNQSYSSEIGHLTNPHNDVALLEKTLKNLQFEVTTVRDAGLASLHQSVNAYARRLQAAGPGAVGFFYYSGHGAADVGTNYLIPVDVKTTETGDLWDQSLRLTEITRKLKGEAGNATHFVVFDACRNNLKLRQPGSRALVQSKGFVPVAQESGMLIAYATAEGELASDAGVGGGLYAQVLAEEIVKPGIEAVAMFRLVQRRIRTAIYQEPFLGFNALPDVYFGGKLNTMSPDVVTAMSEAERSWASAKDTNSISVLEDFVTRYKDTFYASLARARIDVLRKQAMAYPTPPFPAEPPKPATRPATAASTAFPNEPLPAGLQVPAEMLNLIQSDAFFANAPPIRVTAYTIDRQRMETVTTVGQAPLILSDTASIASTIRWLRPAVMSSKDVEDVTTSSSSSAGGTLRSTMHTTNVWAGNGLIILASKTEIRNKLTSSGHLGRLMRLENLSGQLFPVRVGNRFSYDLFFDISYSDNKKHTNRTISMSCNVTKQYDAQTFQMTLIGLAYLAKCSQTLKDNNQGPEQNEARPVFFENLGIWLYVDPVNPKEQIQLDPAPRLDGKDTRVWTGAGRVAELVENQKWRYLRLEHSSSQTGG